jgi:hypothetical protein
MCHNRPIKINRQLPVTWGLGGTAPKQTAANKNLAGPLQSTANVGCPQGRDFVRHNRQTGVPPMNINIDIEVSLGTSWLKKMAILKQPRDFTATSNHVYWKFAYPCIFSGSIYALLLSISLNIYQQASSIDLGLLCPALTASKEFYVCSAHAWKALIHIHGFSIILWISHWYPRYRLSWQSVYEK